MWIAVMPLLFGSGTCPILLLILFLFLGRRCLKKALGCVISNLMKFLSLMPPYQPHVSHYHHHFSRNNPILPLSPPFLFLSYLVLLLSPPTPCHYHPHFSRWMTESDFWYDVILHHIAATTSARSSVLHMQQRPPAVCYPSELVWHHWLTTLCTTVPQFLIHLTFVLIFCSLPPVAVPVLGVFIFHFLNHRIVKIW